MTPVLLGTDRFLDEYGERLRAIAPEMATVALGPSDAIPADELARVTIAFLSKDTWPARAQPFLSLVANAPQLDWLHVFSAGTDNPFFDQLRARGVRVTRTAGASARAIAETVFMFLHGLARDLRSTAASYAARRFEWHEWWELEGRRVAVLGYGPIGQRITELAGAYDMRPTIVRRSVRGDEPYPTRTLDELDRVVAEHDVIVAALPHTAETEGIISRRIIGLMQPHCLFVNVARGALVDQVALTEALAAGRIAGAGLDVFTTEPLPPDDPLWDLPNVLITPHNSGSNRGGAHAVAEVFFANLARYLAGERMPGESPA